MNNNSNNSYNNQCLVLIFLIDNKTHLLSNNMNNKIMIIKGIKVFNQLGLKQ